MLTLNSLILNVWLRRISVYYVQRARRLLVGTQTASVQPSSTRRVTCESTQICSGHSFPRQSAVAALRFVLVVSRAISTSNSQNKKTPYLGDLAHVSTNRFVAVLQVRLHQSVRLQHEQFHPKSGVFCYGYLGDLAHVLINSSARRSISGVKVAF
jgi:hypothetical protein